MRPSEAFALAGRYGRSLAILKRLQLTGNQPELDWLAQARQLKPVFLEGKLSALNPADRAVLTCVGRNLTVGDYLLRMLYIHTVKQIGPPSLNRYV